MIDLGLSKLMLIGVVALVVIGPERLPKVARTAGALLGRAQRYINDVKAEVSREIELDELRKMRTEFEDAARNAQNTIQKNLREHEDALNEAWQTAAGLDESSSAAFEPRVTKQIGASAKRRGWRVRQSAMPLWYKKASLKRTRVQSGAARVARHTPASMRRSIKFF